MKKILFFLLIIPLVLTGCTQSWNDHYDRSDSLPTTTLLSLMDGQPELSHFRHLITIAGMDSVLTATKTFTVWAPDNGALQNVDDEDMEEVKRLVGNHIASGSYASSTSRSQAIVMLNGKTKHYSTASSGEPTFDGVKVVQSDIRAQNGLLHVIEDPVPYRYNILEYIESQENVSDMSQFISSFRELVYDAERSTLYDSVFVTYNRLLEHPRYGIGDIGDEDSLFTMIIPSNKAWQKAYEQVSPHFAVYDKNQAIADSIQHVQTCQAILKGLTFRGVRDDVVTADSMTTTTGCIIRSCETYFSGYQYIPASNGAIYLADDSLVMDASATWLPTLIVEAEDVDSRTTVSGTTAYLRNTDATSLVSGISGDSYLEVSGSSLDGGVTFSIVNLLAGRYDVYCDFVAPEIDGPALAAECTRVQFLLRYQATGGSTRSVNVNSKTDEKLLVGGSDVHGIVSVKAFSAQEFPTSNLYDALWLSDPTHSSADRKANVTLQIKTNVTTAELGKTLARRYRLDRIRFVPVL